MFKICELACSSTFILGCLTHPLPFLVCCYKLTCSISLGRTTLYEKFAKTHACAEDEIRKLWVLIGEEQKVLLVRRFAPQRGVAHLLFC